MAIELPKQLYVARITLKCGAVFDIITEKTVQEIKKELAEHPGVIEGINPQKKWPVMAVIYDEVAAIIHAPHEQWLAARPNLMAQ
jgi:hypothetical protein